MSLSRTLLLLAAALAAPIALAQTPTPAVQPPAFEVATIKPVDPNGRGDGAIGFLSYPGGRVHFGYTNVKMLLYFAFNLQDFQVAGGSDWIGSERYTIEAVPPGNSLSRAQTQARKITPTDEQRQMIQSLLRDRFAFQYHMETHEGPIYILSRGTGKPLLDPPKYPDMDWRGTVMSKPGGIYDGEAFGMNISMASLAKVLTGLLGETVVDQTGIAGTYDFHLPPDDPENQDREAAVLDAMHRLGLNLKRGRGPVATLVIDHVEKPTEN